MIFRTYFEFSFSFIKYPKTASISGKSGISGTGTGLKFVPVPMPDRVRAQFFMPNARRVFRAFRVFGQTGNPIPGLGAVPKKLQVVIVTVVIVHVVELQAVTSYNVTRTKNVLVTLQHVQLQVTTGKTGKNSSKT